MLYCNIKQSLCSCSALCAVADVLLTSAIFFSMNFLSKEYPAEHFLDPLWEILLRMNTEEFQQDYISILSIRERDRLFCAAFCNGQFLVLDKFLCLSRSALMAKWTLVTLHCNWPPKWALYIWLVICCHRAPILLVEMVITCRPTNLQKIKQSGSVWGRSLRPKRKTNIIRVIRKSSGCVWT